MCVTVANNGPSNATGVALVNTLPDGVIYGGISGSAAAVCAPDDGVITCLFGALAAGASRVVSVTVTPFNVGVLVDLGQGLRLHPGPEAGQQYGHSGHECGPGHAPRGRYGPGEAEITITANAFIRPGRRRDQGPGRCADGR